MKLLVAIILVVQYAWAIQTNNTCVPIPKDKRQIICQCSKQLQLRCLFNMDMLIMDTKYLDATIRPIFYDDVSLDRAGDPQDSDDLNNDFKVNKKKFANNRSNMYLYFPNFKLLSQPYIRITLSKFHYIPSFAFTNTNDNDKRDQTAPMRRVESVIFELPNIYDFGVDEFAFHGLQVTDTLLIEGPFNQINVHANAFKNALINELIVGCYCVECEYFEADCKLNLNQASLGPSKYKKSTARDSSNTEIKSIKLFGVDFSLNLDQLPGVDSLEKLEITNMKVPKGDAPKSELRSSRTFPKLKLFNYRNNNLKNLNKLNAFYLFPNLTVASFSQNKLDKLDRDTFKYRTLRNLEELYLERNELTRLDSTMLNANLANLKVLNLNTNKIEQIADATFEQLSSLQVLDLSHNRIAYLNEKTLYGLSNVRKLHLSYNPFKSFDADSFKHVAANLNRLDLISNSDADWFTFDDNDVCLLSHFKCSTQIYIDTDQRCNCFIKYLNLITAGSDSSSSPSDASSSADDVALTAFKPCQLNSVSNSLNRYFDDLNSLYEAGNSHKSVKEPESAARDVDVAKSACDKKSLEKCFANRNASASANSCLYTNLINASMKPATTTTTTSAHLSSQESGQKADERANVSSTSSYLHQLKDKTGVDNASEPKIQKAKSLLWNKYSVEESLTVILIGISFIFIVSMISLFIGVYLIMKRNTFVYHATDSSYPQDEK